jgi:CubicO group peptidase (beta-lactamase class C family)
VIARRAHGYARLNGQFVNVQPSGINWLWTAGAICSTVLDLIKWQTALNTGKAVTPASYRKMTTAGTLNDGSRFSYGYGLFVDSLDGHARIQHGGDIPGFHAMLAHYPDDELTIAVLTNSDGADAGKLANRIARIVLRLREPPPN